MVLGLIARRDTVLGLWVGPAKCLYHPSKVIKENVMADQNLTPDEVKEILRKNGVESLDQLANLIAAGQAGKPFQPDISPVAASWVIKVWKLDAGAADLMPDHLGGDIIKNKLGGAGDLGGGGQ